MFLLVLREFALDLDMQGLEADKYKASLIVH